MIPRQSYFTVYRQEIRDHFVEFITNFDKKDDIWFEFNDEPIAWHLPTGVLFDLKNTTKEMPWNLTVHFNSYPVEKVLKVSSDEETQWNFINSLKEVGFL